MSGASRLFGDTVQVKTLEVIVKILDVLHVH